MVVVVVVDIAWLGRDADRLRVTIGGVGGRVGES